MHEKRPPITVAEAQGEHKLRTLTLHIPSRIASSGDATQDCGLMEGTVVVKGSDARLVGIEFVTDQAEHLAYDLPWLGVGIITNITPEKERGIRSRALHSMKEALETTRWYVTEISSPKHVIYLDASNHMAVVCFIETPLQSR